MLHSIASENEGLMRASRHALFYSTFNSPSDLPAARFVEMMVNLLEESYADDRHAIPLLETIALVMEQATQLAEEHGHKLPTRRLWNVVRKAQFKSTNIRKLEAAVRIYAALAAQGEMQKHGLCKLKDLLLHPYPRVSFPIVGLQSINNQGVVS